jgi:mono/diheme cytochrome c family protein
MKRSMRWALIAGLASAAMLLPPAVGAQEAPDGREVYLANCAACHQGTGVGVPGSFPPLADNPNIGDSGYVRDVILNGKTGPIDVNGVTFDAEMPAQAQLSDDEVDAVIAYIQAGVFVPADTAPVGEGGASVGEKLFLGRIGLENGGPACHACHSAGTHTDLGGPTLGPDLTDLANRYGGADAVAAALANPPSATMQPIFDGQALTDQERADLGAYFGSIRTQTLVQVDLLWILGLAGAALLLGLMYFFPKRNRVNYLRQLRSRS